MKRTLTTLPLLLAALVLAAPAHAETALTPFVGLAFGGKAEDSKVTYGGAIGFYGDGVGLGFEVDFGYTPEFFPGGNLLRDSNVTTLMGNLLFVASGGSARFYAAGGVGLLKTRVSDVDGFFDVDSNDFGLNVGGGLEFALGDRLGLRGDLRYFRALTDPQPDNEFDIDLADLDFFRATVGLSLKL